MQITDEMVDTGMAAWHKAIIDAPDEPVPTRRRRCIRAALEAALARPAEAELANLRHQCAASGYHDHDGCTCTEEELRRRAAPPEPQAAQTPQGWMLVPIEPTKAMATSAAEAHYGVRRVKAANGIHGIAMTVEDVDYDFWRAFRKFWRGALAAAPNPEAGR